MCRNSGDIPVFLTLHPRRRRYIVVLEDTPSTMYEEVVQTEGDGNVG
ncbi:unnamed protein product [Cuscuta epithymum]|uniref:Uncharacterized protein n=1 Tax=Cuscuta epithymum TaxID=186058 RepID=A0AAV0D6Q9_9ASTE|nr:unnamed protein product [Cuscuta epithymum]